MADQSDSLSCLLSPLGSVGCELLGNGLVCLWACGRGADREAYWVCVCVDDRGVWFMWLVSCFEFDFQALVLSW